MSVSEEKFQNKLVAVLNKSIEPGKVMNALAHITLVFLAHLLLPILAG